MMVRLTDMMRTVAPGSSFDPGFACVVTGLTVCSEGRVEIHLLAERWLPAAAVIAVEEALEAYYGVAEVLAVQRVSDECGSPDSDIAVAWMPWALRHLRRSDPWLFLIVSGAQFTSDPGGIWIHLPRECMKQVATGHLAALELIFERATGYRCPVRATASDEDLRELIEQQESERPVLCVPASASEPVPVATAAETARGANEQEAVLENARYRYRKKLARREDGLIFGRFDSQMEPVEIGELHVQSGIVCFRGEIVESAEPRLVSNQTRILIKFSVSDGTGTLSCHGFLKPEEYEEISGMLSLGSHVKVQAKMGFDGKFTQDLDAGILGVCTASAPRARADQAPERRAELHCHTKMSARDGVADAAEIVRTAARWKWPAVAITDHGVVQAFPEAYAALKETGTKNTKILYGVECYLVDDGPAAVYGLDGNEPPEDELDDEPALADGYVAIDVETTGLDPSRDQLIEIGAVRFVRSADGRFVEDARFETFVDPGIPIPELVTKLTGIHPSMLPGAPDPYTAVARLRDFVGKWPVCAHNLFFDLSFIRYAGFQNSTATGTRGKFNPVAVDTLRLSRLLYPKERVHKLDAVAARLGITQKQHHRAADDAATCGRILDALIHQTQITSWRQLNAHVGHLAFGGLRTARTPVYHCVLLAADTLGLYHLYRLISESHVRYFYNKTPRVPRSLLDYHRAGLLVGAACEAGEVFRKVAALYRANNRSYEQTATALNAYAVKSLARYYDYLEIQPLCNNRFMIGDAAGTAVSEQDLIDLNRLVLALGDAAGRPVCATCDAHFIEESDTILRQILTADMYDDFASQPALYLRTTDEMLAAFQYLGERAREVVIDNPVAVAERVQSDLQPFPAGFYPPVLETAARDVEQITWEAAWRIYGHDQALPPIVSARIEKELRSIIDNGFATMYDIARRLVKQSNDDGYLVGSRGSVGSSLIASLCGITEVNPLAPHYVCPHCRYSEFDLSGRFGSGYDLPDRVCPACGHALAKEGQDIPFETFLGFTGDKTPDIDLNFSGEYQARAHNMIEEMFGKEFTFKAGTISTYAEKNTMAMVRGYFEKTGGYATEAEKRRLANRLQGVRQTTGQHPGAIVVVPQDREIYDFTPVHHPADKAANGIITTHFDFNSLHDTLLKLDVLGKDDPTMLRFLEQLTGVEVLRVPFMDPQVMSLFTSTRALGIADGSWDVPIGTLSIPEMGTFMARAMIRDIRPQRFYDLVQLMGLSHGKNVWVGNAQDLIRQGTCDITEVIGCRDSIMTALIQFGLTSQSAFDIMERVRKGRGLTASQEADMREHNVPEWYIDSCKKISYMFPKAHAVAYAITALRLAWFKVYHPIAYYCAFFTVRADEFDCVEMCTGLDRVRERRLDIAARRNSNDGDATTALEDRKYYILELIEEMHLRGIGFEPVDIYRSDASRFEPSGKNRILPPLNAVPGISSVSAARVVAARAAGPFTSREDLAARAALGSAIMTTLDAIGCLDGIPDRAQLDLFSLG